MRGGNDNSGLKLFFMGIRGLGADENIHIQQVQALGDKQYDKTLPDIKNVAGVVTKVETKIKRSEKYGDHEEIVIWLKDAKAGELYAVSCGMNSIGRSIINALASVQGDLGEVYLAVYNNDKNFPSVFIKNNGEKLSWKYSLEEQNKYVKQTTKKVKVGKETVNKTERDYFELNEFLLGVWKTDVKAKVKALDSTKDHPVVNDGPDGPQDDTEVLENNSVIDDLPF